MNLINKFAVLALLVTAISAGITKLSDKSVDLSYGYRDKVDEDLLVQAPTCPGPHKNIKCEGLSNRYRTLDGTCNNLKYPWWGAVQTPYNRLVQPIPTCNADAPRTDTLLDISGLPPAYRVVDQIPSFYGLYEGYGGGAGSFFALFVQFMANDLSSTVPAYVQCECGSTEPECFNIQLDKSDQSIFYRDCLNYVRSLDSREAFDCAFDHREQFSNVSHYLDLSNLYGSNAAQNSIVRSYVDGQLRCDSVLNSITPSTVVPPILDINQCLTEGERTEGCFYGADNQRSFADPLITTLHTRFLREHNRFAFELKKRNSHWSDNTIYEESRRLLIAVYQSLVYTEVLPYILGEEKYREFELKPLTSGYGNFYNDNLYPNVYNEFAEAAFKLVNFNDDAIELDSYTTVQVRDLFWRQDKSYAELENYAIALLAGEGGPGGFNIAKDLLKSYAETPTSLPSSLPALIVQKGRDHALASYTTYRNLAGVGNANKFADLANVDDKVIELLEPVYNHVSDIDLFMGLLAEDIMEGALIGKTQAFIIAKQFNMLKFGDRFYFENGEDIVNRFSLAQLDSIRGYSFLPFICKTFSPVSKELNHVPHNPLMSANEMTNPLLGCFSDELAMTDIDFDLWTETKASYY